MLATFDGVTDSVHRHNQFTILELALRSFSVSTRGYERSLLVRFSILRMVVKRTYPKYGTPFLERNHKDV